MKRTLLIGLAVVVAILVTATIGASFYMLDYSLAPDGDRTDTARYFRQLADDHPETKRWADSLIACHVLCDTFVTMPSGERHHAYFARQDSSRHIAIVVHGWRDCAIEFFHIARIYHQLLGFNVLMPDLHAHGLSEGDAIGMGWNDRRDVLHWMTVAARLFKSDDFVVHGVSMGAATTMNVSGEPLPSCVSSIRFVEDCGYTSVWDEFSYEISEEFHLPDFPLMYTTSLLCKLKYGWSFDEASPLRQVAKCRAPMLFIHGDNDTFVPSRMVHPLHEAKTGQKSLWITKGTEHAVSYDDYPEEYVQRLKSFVHKKDRSALPTF